MMHIRYTDGFTGELISFTCEIDGSVGLVQAQWFDPTKNRRDCHSEFSIDIPTDFSSTLETQLRPLAEFYDVPWTDLDWVDVVFPSTSGDDIHRSFYGLSEYFFDKHPDLRDALTPLLDLCNEIRARIKTGL